ncbi:MAG: MAPEG family protein [Burkholderiales bacterium]|nr:MAPEG family protein [Burkholderiales bacterium]
MRSKSQGAGTAIDAMPCLAVRHGEPFIRQTALFKEPHAMTLTTIVLLVLALYLVQIFLQEVSRFGFDPRGIVGNRDDLPALSVMAGRLDRAKNNLLESLPIFLALALLALVKGRDTVEVDHAALVFLVARAVYVPAYVSGIPMLRSMVWLVAVGSLAGMALPLI